MIFKNRDILVRVNILNEYCAKRFPQRISYAITRNVMIFSDEIKSYNEELKKILDNYKEYYVKNDKGETQVNEVSGLPVIAPEHSNDFMRDVMELLEIEIDVKPYFVDESLFDYDDEKYDVMSAVDIMNLQNVLCDKSAKTKED